MELIALLDKMEEKLSQLESATREGGAEAAVPLPPPPEEEEEEEEENLTDENLSTTASTLGGSTQDLNAGEDDDRGEDFVDVETVDEEEQTWNWTATFRERQFNMLKFGFFTDFSILVGGPPNNNNSQEKEEEEPKEERLIKVHKSMLASCSPVFYNEILKAISDGKKELQVSDDPRTFILFLRYVYVGDSGANVREAFLLQKLAKKYQVPELMEQCDKIIMNQELNLESAFALLPVAVNLHHKALTEGVINFICKNGETFLKNDKFLGLPLNAVLEIVKRDDLNVVYDTAVLCAVVKWGQAQFKKEPLNSPADSTNPDNFGPYITSLLPHVRFPCELDSPFWFKTNEGPINSEDKFESVLNKKDWKLFNSVVRKYSKPYEVVISRLSNESKLHPNRGPLAQHKFKETLVFQNNMPYVMYGFGLVKGMFGENYFRNIYDYSDISVNVTIMTKNQSWTPETTSLEEPELQVNTYEVYFDEPIDLPAQEEIMLILSFTGTLKYRLVSNQTAKFSTMPLTRCPTYMATHMKSSFTEGMIPDGDLNMIFPLKTTFRRPTPGEPYQHPIEKGFITNLWLSFNQPNPDCFDMELDDCRHLDFFNPPASFVPIN